MLSEKKNFYFNELSDSLDVKLMLISFSFAIYSPICLPINAISSNSIFFLLFFCQR